MARTPSLLAALCGFCLFLAASARGDETTPVILTWSEDPQTSVTVFWQRDEPGRATVRYGLTTNYTHGISDAGGLRRHRITLRNLEPGTAYHYEAYSTDGFAAGDRTFRTAPGPGEAVHAVVYGDAQGGMDINMEGATRGVISAIRWESPDLVMSMGDMAIEDYGGMGYDTWNLFFNTATDLLDRVVFMPTPGNHDVPTNGTSLFWQFFSLPQRPVLGSPYSYRAGNLHFPVLSSEYDLVRAQTNWLMRDLQAAAYDTNVTWIVPYFHRPPYSWGQRAGEDFVRTNWCPLLTMYEADLVFSGHSHNYQRTVPIRGVTYVVSGGGGAALYTSEFTPGSHEYATTCFHYVSMQVTGSVMRYRAIRSDGLVFEDHVWTNARRKVRVEPAFPVRGASCKILYDAAQGPLFYSSPVYIHLGVDAFTNALADAAMTYNAGSGFWEYDYIVPAGTSNRVAFVFHDAAATNWDNNYEYNWQALLDDSSYSFPTSIPPRMVVPGSPVISDDPAGQNNVGDNFDFSTNGMPLQVRQVAGFGDFGRLYFNVDDTNLYVGGVGADLGGTNNVFVLFLGMDTLTDNAGNLWHKSGLPQTLDQMHNIGLAEPMDLAIVFGDEYGDGPAYTNYSYGGYDFGQGVYYIGTNSAVFVAITNARLSQFDGTGLTPCAGEDDDGNRQTDRWEASIPWAALNAPQGVASLNWLLVNGVIASSSTNGNDRYLSATHIGQRAFGTIDPYGSFGKNFVTVEPFKIALEHGDEDADGMDNRSEAVAGTRLDDAASFFHADSEAGPDRFVVRWSSESNRTYALHGATNLPAGFSPWVTNLPATPPSNAHTTNISSAQSGYFRVSVKR